MGRYVFQGLVHVICLGEYCNPGGERDSECALKFAQVVVMDARELFCAPGRAKRPRRIAVVLRGLPGSGKTRVAGRLRDIEVAAGGEPPRIHSIDEYFVTVCAAARNSPPVCHPHGYLMPRMLWARTLVSGVCRTHPAICRV